MQNRKKKLEEENKNERGSKVYFSGKQRIQGHRDIKNS